MRGKSCVACAAVLILGACRSLTEYEPIIDTQGIDMSAYEQDLLDCRAYGDQVAVASRSAAGAATGAVVGGVFGAVVGNRQTARTTAGAGGVTGGLGGASSAYAERREVIRNCLLGRGYRVLN